MIIMLSSSVNRKIVGEKKKSCMTISAAVVFIIIKIDVYLGAVGDKEEVCFRFVFIDTEIWC